MVCPHIFGKEVGQIVEVQLRVHRGQLHGQKLQKVDKNGNKRFRWQFMGFHDHLCICWLIYLTMGMCVFAYLDLPLQRLHVVYDLVEHDGLANHLKQATFFRVSNLGTPLNLATIAK